MYIFGYIFIYMGYLFTSLVIVLFAYLLIDSCAADSPVWRKPIQWTCGDHVWVVLGHCV